jgi:signal transduction histidine kinase
MKNKFRVIILILTVYITDGNEVDAQGLKTINRLKNELNNDLPDTARVIRLANIGYQYGVINPETGLDYLWQSLDLARKNKFKYGEALSLTHFGWVYRHKSDFKNAIMNLNESDKISDQFPFIKGSNLMIRAYIDFDLQEYSASNEKAIKARDIFNTIKEKHRELVSSMILLDVLDARAVYDTALIVAKNLYDFAFKNEVFNTYGIISTKLARAYLKRNMPDSASPIIDQALRFGEEEGNTRVIIFGNQYKAQKNIQGNNIDSAIYFATRAFIISMDNGFFFNALQLSKELSNYYLRNNNKDLAFQYEKTASQLKDSVYGLPKMATLQKSIIEQLNESFFVKEEGIKYNNQRRQRLLLGLSLFFVVFSLFTAWAYKRIKIEKTISDSALLKLQSTQNQLIHSEKMASLGELTAGIAHEIQNPLNFVNNFSELNNELIKELEEESRNEHRDARNEAELITIIKENSEKINHHGKRAESIVKGMLEHSRKSTGVKEPTNINKLCDEYVRLSYQGLRAKKKEFICDYKLDLDPNLPLVNVVTQDIGRVILNIINNAFQACNEKSQDLKKRIEQEKSPMDTDPTLRSLPTGQEGLELVSISGGRGKTEKYQPLISLATRNLDNLIEIKITDDGPGIPDSIKDKIFQPFFTTKPTGQGTGLGLSLAYDIVKAHSGELKVETKEHEGSTFIIQLPIN